MSKQQYKESLEGISKEQILLYPQEQLAPIKKKNAQILIGLPKEKNPNEKRIALCPEAVELLVNNGHEVRIEAGAGLGAQFDDREYAEAGAQICYTAKEVFESDVVIKIDPPIQEEIEAMRSGKTLVSSIPAASLNAEYIQALLKKKIVSVAFDFLEDSSGSMPIVRAMSEIAGSTVMLIAAEYLSSSNSGKGIILGGVTGVPPSKIVIIGAGTVGEYAARTAIGLGAELKIFDKSIYRLRRIKYAIGHQVFTSTLDPALLKEAISRADVVIGAMRAEGARSPFVITEEMVSSMRPNSVIIDVSVDQGGCIETSEITTHQNPVYKKYGVIHYAVPNIASRVARTSSTALSNIFADYLLETGDRGGIDDMIFTNNGFMKGVYTYKGSLTNIHIAKRFGLNYKELGLLMAARL